jgi:hypothetical protein
MSELNRSPWSCHSALMGSVQRERQDAEYILSFLERTPREGKTSNSMCSRVSLSGAGLSWLVLGLYEV